MRAQALAALRDEVCRELDVPTKDVELSMGMSGDFEQAVRTTGTLFFVVLCKCMQRRTRQRCGSHALMCRRSRWAAPMYEWAAPSLEHANMPSS